MTKEEIKKGKFRARTKNYEFIIIYGEFYAEISRDRLTSMETTLDEYNDDLTHVDTPDKDINSIVCEK